MTKFKPTEFDFMKEVDTPSGVTLEEVDAQIYGNVGVRESGRVVIKPVDIMDIWPDLAQPRRAIPLAVRGQWHGNPLHVIEVLDTWQRMAESAAGITLDMVDILQGRGEGFDTEEKPTTESFKNPVTESFIDLLRLAASIFKDGLTNAITIAPGKDRFLIETGERRWLAHHLLYHHVDDKFGRILAREVQRDVWRQATENNQRRKLNAIEMARQLALLVMDMYEGDRNTRFDSLEMMMRDGCDRYFYAQVAQGRIWKVKDGFAERVQAAMGLPSYSQVSRYRNLLRLTDDDKLNDEIWIRADMENWTEFTTRTYIDELVKPKPVESLPTGKHGDENTLPTGGVTIGESLPIGKHDTSSTVDFTIGQRVIIDGNPDIQAVIASRKSVGGYTVNMMKGGSQWFASGRLTPVDTFPNTSSQPTKSNQPEQSNPRSTTTPTIKEESGALDNESDYTTPGDSETPKPIDTRLVIQKLADIAALLDLPEQPILDDLAKLNRERLQAIIQDGGYDHDLLEQLMNDYYKATTDAVEKIRRWGHTYIDAIRAAGFEMIERR